MSSQKIVFCALIFGATTSMAAWVDTNNTINYAYTVGDTTTWKIQTTNVADPGWFTQSYAYNNDQIIAQNWWQSTPSAYVVQSQNGAYGGVVYHFTNTSGSTGCLVDILAAYDMRNAAGKKIVLYYSDVNDWNQLTPMTGSRWDGWGQEWETNPNWTRVDYNASWGGSGYFSLTGTQASSDGNFYVRVDMSMAGSNPGDLELGGVTVTVLPEPASLGLLALGGLALFRRRR